MYDDERQQYEHRIMELEVDADDWRAAYDDVSDRYGSLNHIYHVMQLALHRTYRDNHREHMERLDRIGAGLEAIAAAMSRRDDGEAP